MTQALEHTPGTWYADGERVSKSVAGGSVGIAYAFTNTDALLIAVAPEMEAELRRIIESGEIDRRRIDAILAKSKGGDLHSQMCSNKHRKKTDVDILDMDEAARDEGIQSRKLIAIELGYDPDLAGPGFTVNKVASFDLESAIAFACEMLRSQGAPVPDGFSLRTIFAAQKLLAFVESITDATGPYGYLNGTAIVGDAYQLATRARTRAMGERENVESPGGRPVPLDEAMRAAERSISFLFGEEKGVGQ